MFQQPADALAGHASSPGRRGRAQEWAVVAGLLRTAESSRGGVLLVEGRPGMGKTRLLDGAVEAAAERGFALARAAADEPGRLMPLGPLLAALGKSALTLRAAMSPPPPDVVDLRLSLVERLQALLEERAAAGPLLMVLDDLHWADPTTILALRSLIPELASYPLAWILSRRTGGGEVERLFDVLERDGAWRIVLGPLDDQAVAEVITDVLEAGPEPELLALAAGAGGNPCMLGELLGGLCEEKAIEISGGRAHLVSERLPRRMKEIWRHRLARLSPHARHLLQVAAVLGRSFSVDDLADMLGEPPSRLLPALEEAEATGAVVPGSDTLRFRHEMLWQAVTETISPPVRQALHRQAGEMLLGRGGSAIPAAAHLMCQARPGDARTLDGLDRATHEVLPSSPQTAADLALRALDLTPVTDPDRFDRTMTAVYALTTTGRLAEASQLARSALRHAVSPCQVARLHYELAHVLLLTGRPVDAVTEADEALTEEDLSGELRDLAEQVRFQGLFASHDHRRGREQAEAVVAAEERHSALALVGAHLLLTMIAVVEGRAACAVDHVRAAMRIAAGGPIRARHAHPVLQLVTLLTDARRFDEAETALQAAAEEITALGHTAFGACPALFRARLRLAEGRLDDAAAEAQSGLAMAGELGTDAFAIMGIAVLAIVAVRRGDIDAAATYAERHGSQRQASQGAQCGIGWGDWAAALAAEAQDGPGRAMRVLGAVFGDPAERCWLLMSEPAAAAWLTRTALTAGDRSGAQTVAAAAGRLAARNPGFPTLTAAAAHAHGVLHQDRAALCRATAHPDPWSRASASEDLGVLLARSAGEREAAVHALDRALDGYQGTGATRDAARVRARLRELGVRRRHWIQAERPVSGWASLTDTERDVAVLVARGLTNPQVAAQMFVSPHTVKFHLRQVFRKLGIGSRIELARLAAEGVPEGP
ncbi:AAA family ATPase [Microbispora sp. NPDC049125]|uniref:helix-turn-helix transcriptional regulator n=1 Tax=Microbispora sp. NPDC049125 TaxID=3154929 RepID=UPI00346562BE